MSRLKLLVVLSIGFGFVMSGGCEKSVHEVRTPAHPLAIAAK